MTTAELSPLAQDALSLICERYERGEELTFDAIRMVLCVASKSRLWGALQELVRSKRAISRRRRHEAVLRPADRPALAPKPTHERKPEPRSGKRWTDDTFA